MTSIMQYLANGIVAGGIYALVGIGLIIIFKATGVFNFAVGQLLLLGAFAAWAFLSWFGLPVWLSIFLSLLFAVVVGILIERLITRRLIGQPVLAAVVALLALSIFLTGLISIVFGPSIVAYPTKILPETAVRVWGVSLSTELLSSFLISIVVFGALTALIRYSKIGLGMRATAEDHQLAQASGINVKQVFAASWVAAAIVAALGGILIGIRVGVGVNYTPLVGLKVIPVVIFGGLESIGGCFIAGLIVGVLENLAAGLIDPKLMEVTPYIILLLALLFRPYGLFGLKRIERV